MTREIIQVGNHILRDVANKVNPDTIGEKQLNEILKEMKDVLSASADGVALAAPQIGYSFRIFVVSGIYFSENLKEREKEEIEKMQNMDDKSSIKHFVFINPDIIKRSSKKIILDEGCLSAKNKFGTISRSEKVTMRALDETGKKITIGAIGLLSQIFQHETDHLNGILFIDSANDVQEITPKG